MLVEESIEDQGRRTAMLMLESLRRSAEPRLERRMENAQMSSYSKELPKLVVPPELSSFISTLCIKLWHEPACHPCKSPSPLPPILSTPPFSQTPASFSQWVHRVLSTTNVPLSIVFLALLFIHRLRSTIPAPPAGSEFIVFIAGLMVAMKSPQGCDNTYTNKGWHRISKVPLHLLNAMELQMLISLRFDMWVSEQGFSVWLQFIEGAIAQHMGQSFSSSVVQPVYPKRSASLNQSSPTAGTATRSHHRHTRNLSDGHLSRPAPLRPPTLQNMMAASAYPSPTNLSPASATSTSSSSGVHIADMSGDAFSAAPRSVSPIVIPVVGHAKVTSLNTRQYHHQQFLHSQDKQRLYVHHHHPGHPIEPPSFDSMQRRAPAHLRYHPSPPSSHHGSPELAGPVVPILPPQLR